MQLEIDSLLLGVSSKWIWLVMKTQAWIFILNFSEASKSQWAYALKSDSDAKQT